VDTVHECDRQRDGQTDRITITKTVQRIAYHGKNLVGWTIHCTESKLSFTPSLHIGANSNCSVRMRHTNTGTYLGFLAPVGVGAQSTLGDKTFLPENYV